MISVITSTISMGGLDMLFYSLSYQRGFTSFEVILVDEWYEERKDLVSGRLHAWNVKHLPPDHKRDFIDHCNGWNTGLRRAEGELICFLNDYIWAYPGYLKDHWDIYKNHSGYSMVGYLDRYPWPAINLSKDTKDIWWTQFKQEFTSAAYFSLVEPVYSERKGGAIGPRIGDTAHHSISGDKFYASLNESIPLAVLKELNGWDERYDAGYGSNDIDLGVRAEMAGWKFLLNPTINYKIGMYGMQRLPHSIIKPQLRNTAQNHAMYLNRMEEIKRGGPLAVPQGYGAW